MLESLFARLAGWRIHRPIIVGESAAENRKALNTLEQLTWEDTRERQMLYLQDASAPPIQATMAFLRECRAAAGEGSRLTGGLIGTPEQGVPFAAAQKGDVEVWQRRIDSLGDLRIGLLKFAT